MLPASGKRIPVVVVFCVLWSLVQARQAKNLNTTARRSRLDFRRTFDALPPASLERDNTFAQFISFATELRSSLCQGAFQL